MLQGSQDQVWIEVCCLKAWQYRIAKYCRKHYLRHTKPFHCSDASCSRKEGFSTVVDLNRHVQSQHPDASTEIPKAYQCQVAGCKSKDKTWPRLDNFKSHLKRMHRLPDEEIIAMVLPTYVWLNIRKILLIKVQSTTACNGDFAGVARGISIFWRLARISMSRTKYGQRAARIPISAPSEHRPYPKRRKWRN